MIFILQESIKLIVAVGLVLYLAYIILDEVGKW